MRYVRPNNIDVLILCGGLGKRIQSVAKDLPKSMVKINSQPFLDILIDYIADFGFKRFILCIGYMGNAIKRYYQNKKCSLEIIFSEENEPLGTAGAIKNAESLIKSSSFLVINGDTFCQLDLSEFLKFHFNKNTLLSIVVANIRERNDYGFVTLSDSQQILGFNEKIRNHNEGFINTGFYLFQRRVLPLIPKGENLSLEKDFFSEIIAKENIYGYITQGYFIDIGTPESYKEAKQFFSEK